MTFAIDMTPELENRIRNAAEKIGLSPDDYILQIIQQSLPTQTQPSSTRIQLSKKEADLIQTINSSLSHIDWQRYRALIKKRQMETFTEDEQTILTSFSDELERANINRIASVIKLAKLRNTSVEKVMFDLELKPAVYE